MISVNAKPVALSNLHKLDEGGLGDVAQYLFKKLIFEIARG